MEELEFSRAMVVMPHPDDGEFSAGGSMARWAAEGKEVILVCVTNGAAGSNDPKVERDWLIATREQEQREAADITGIKDVIFLGYEDGYVEDSHELRRDLIREIRRFKPEVVVSMDPSTFYRGNRYVNHTDHRKVGEAFFAALSPGATTVPLYRSELYDKGFGPHRPNVCLLTGSESPDFYVDISDYIDLKVQAIRAHKSQFAGGEGIEQGVRMLAQYNAQNAGIDAEYAEAFKGLFSNRPWVPPGMRPPQASRTARRPPAKRTTARKKATTARGRLVSGAKAKPAARSRSGSPRKSVARKSTGRTVPKSPGRKSSGGRRR